MEVTKEAQSTARLFVPVVIVFAIPDLVVILWETEEGKAIIFMTIGASFMALIARITR